MIIDIHRHSALRMFLLTVTVLLTAGCELPKDKIIDYSSLDGTITGFSKPTYMKCIGNHLYTLDDNGLYRINLSQINLHGDTVSSSDIYYQNNSISPYGKVKNFDVSGDSLFLITYDSDSSTHYILHIDMSRQKLSDGLQSWKVPSGRSANYVTVCDNALVISGNAHIAVKGFDYKDASGDIKFDTTADYCYTKDYSDVDNITVSSMSPIAYKKDNKYEIFVISNDTDQMGIRKYLYDADSTADNIFLKHTNNTTLYPMNIQFKPGDTSAIISSEVSGVTLYSVTTNADESVSFAKTNTVSLGKDNGILKTLPYGSDKIAALYGYQVKANEYDAHAYDIMAYWYGVKIISDAYSSSPAVTAAYTMEGWGTDMVLFNKYLLASNQVKNRINIIRLD